MKRILITLALIFIVLFPSPLIIIQDYQRVQNPPIDSRAIENTSELPDDPNKIERWVENEIEYQYDFESYGTFWYIPEPDQILEKGKGDCKSRAILLASIFEKKDIDYELHMSLFHWWISYESNNKTWAEDETTSLKTGDDWRTPDMIKTLDNMWSVRDEYFDMIWTSMPKLRKLFFLTSMIYLWVPMNYYNKSLKSLIKYKSRMKTLLTRIYENYFKF